MCSMCTIVDVSVPNESTGVGRASGNNMEAGMPSSLVSSKIMICVVLIKDVCPSLWPFIDWLIATCRLICRRNNMPLSDMCLINKSVDVSYSGLRWSVYSSCWNLIVIACVIVISQCQIPHRKWWEYHLSSSSLAKLCLGFDITSVWFNVVWSNFI